MENKFSVPNDFRYMVLSENGEKIMKITFADIFGKESTQNMWTKSFTVPEQTAMFLGLVTDFNC